MSVAAEQRVCGLVAEVEDLVLKIKYEDMSGSLGSFRME